MEARLGPGQILALSSLGTTANGTFVEGDVGLGWLVSEGRVEISWPNGTSTRTVWPNLSWYSGRPLRAQPGQPLLPGTGATETAPPHVMALASLCNGDNGSFAAGDVGTCRQVEEGRAEISWPNGTRTLTAWPNPSWYAAFAHPLPLEREPLLGTEATIAEKPSAEPWVADWGACSSPAVSAVPELPTAQAL